MDITITHFPPEKQEPDIWQADNLTPGQLRLFSRAGWDTAFNLSANTGTAITFDRELAEGMARSRGITIRTI